MGFFEYFQLSEDIGAEPLPILNCGMACQFNTGELVPLDELEPYIQDALDLIEFANGPVDSEWGARRAALGHPEPFGMKLLGVGNEQWGPQYVERYEVFAKALKEKHPEIELVSGAGPLPADERFQFLWPQLRELNADIVDEHCYAMPDWFYAAATRYDDYARNGPKVFMGEYAAQSVDIVSPDNRNNLECALAEAAFMTGLERNSRRRGDVVLRAAVRPRGSVAMAAESHLVRQPAVVRDAELLRAAAVRAEPRRRRAADDDQRLAGRCGAGAAAAVRRRRAATTTAA